MENHHSTPAKRPGKMILHMIGNAHIDPVWLWNWQAGLDEALASFRSAADRCEEYPEFIYTRGEAWLYKQVETIDPELFGRVRKLIGQGRWQITGGQWLQPDTNLPTHEGWRRQILHGQRYFQDRFGVTSRVGYNVDSFGHPGTLPDILSEFGYRGYVFHRPGPEKMTLPAQTFRWRGPKGGELTGFRIAPCYVTRSDDLYGQIMLSAEAADPAVGHTMCFYGVGNHGGGPTKANIEYILEHANAFPGVELRFSHPEAFFDAIETLPLPVVEDELQHTFPGCYSVMHDIKQNQHRGEHHLKSAMETIETFSDTAVSSREEHALLDLAWEDLLFTQFHDILAGTSIDSAWTSVRAMQGRAFIWGEEIIARVTRKWARRHLPALPHQQIVLLNPRPSEWRGEVEWEPSLDFDLWRDRWLSLPDGTPVEFQEVQPASQLSHFHRVLFFAQIPAKEALQILVRDDARPKMHFPASDLRITPSVLENSHISIKLAPHGITSLRCDGREILGEGGLGLLLREDKTDTWTFATDRYEGPVLDRLKDGIWKMEEHGPLRARACLEGWIGRSRVRWTLSLPRDGRHLSMTLEVNFSEHDALLQMPMSLASPPQQWTDGQPGGWIDRLPGLTEWPVQNWSRLRWKDFSAAWITEDAYSLSCRPDCWQWTLLRSPRMAFDGNGPDVYCGHDTFADQGFHRFDLTLLLEPDLSCETLQAETIHRARPPVIFEHYEGMNRPAWGNNPPQRLSGIAEQRSALHKPDKALAGQPDFKDSASLISS